MDTARYDDKTRAMIDETMGYLRNIDPRAKKTLARLKRQASRTSDNALMGMVWYYEAYLTYYTDSDYTRFRPQLSKAIGCLMRSGDKALLARAYNFVAVDAHNNGSYDIAYNYYMSALRFVEERERNVVAGLIETNLGRLFSELDDYATARKHIRRGEKILRLVKDDLRYWFNVIAASINVGTTSLELGDTESARKACARIERYLKMSSEDVVSEIRLPYLLLCVRLSMETKDRRTVRKEIRKIIETLELEGQIHEYAEDINGFFKALMAHKLYEETGLFIDAINDKVMDTGIIHVCRLFSEIKVDYYVQTHDRAKMIASLEEQHTINIRQRAEQKKLFRYSVDLINLAADLRDEQEKVRRENEILQIQAQTDALTGIPNRYTLNKELEAAFERAYKNKYLLGVEILDVDYFKEYNDTYGHPAGDKCLEIVAGELISLAKRPGIFCARYGGDEFVILYEDMTYEEVLQEAGAFGRKIAAHKIRHRASDGGQFVTVSQGICCDIPKKKNKPWDFLSEADAALYSIKKGRGRRKNQAPICLRQLPDTYPK